MRFTFGMKFFGCAVLIGVVCLESAPGAEQFVLFNLTGGRKADAFTEINKAIPCHPTDKVRVGIGAIFSYLDRPRVETMTDLREFLRLAQETDTPVVVQLDGENWWGNRPDLWNWWDTNQAGYSPANRANVEWTNWSSDSAIKIAWRNWGTQYRMLPAPNLMSQPYRAACREEMRVLIPIVLDWWRALPAKQKELLVGIKVGHESSVGVNAWYYPGGNELLGQSPAKDPIYGLKPENIPARGVTQIGYAAVKTAGIRTNGVITEADLAEVARRHLEDLCREAARLGVPRKKLFTHTAGWREGELLYGAANNSLSCPGWSFYKHAADPRGDIGVQQALKASDAPYWAAVEWLCHCPPEKAAWQKALTATLADKRCRYLCIYNWPMVRDNVAAMDAIREIIHPAR